METPSVPRVLGVDPGTLKMGYGVLEATGEALQVVSYGVLKASSAASLEERLARLFQGLVEGFETWCPTTVAVEEPFVGGNPRSALAVGRAQAVVLLAAAQRGIPVSRYSPAQVKQSVTDYGRGSKEQVQEMVRLLLGLTGPLAPDAADALAVALCHLRSLRLPAELRDTAAPRKDSVLEQKSTQISEFEGRMQGKFMNFTSYPWQGEEAECCTDLGGHQP